MGIEMRENDMDMLEEKELSSLSRQKETRNIPMQVPCPPALLDYTDKLILELECSLVSN